MSYWRGKVVLVTGGSSGLGLSTAGELAAQGARLVIAARGEEKLEHAVKILRDLGSEVSAVVTDITVQADVERLLEKVIDDHGRLDMLVNCAGISTRGKAIETTPEEFQRLWDLNFLGLVRCTQAAMPHLIRSQGHLVNIGSLASKIASRFLGGYPASKFAVAAYSQQLRLELGPQGVHVLLVCPGPISRDDAKTNDAEQVDSDRYHQQTKDLPASAKRPGGGAKIKAVDPRVLAKKILAAAEKRRAELVVPGKARFLAAILQFSPSLGDWILRKVT